MYILALETTGAHASVAIIDEHGQTVEKKSDGVLNHLQLLIPMVDELLKENKLQLGDMTAIAASQGPGSFTGIRIGVSTARALAQILSIKTIAVPTLDAFAYNCPGYEGLICPLFDARRSQVYSGAYKWQDREIVQVIKGAPYAIEELADQLRATGEKKILLFGDGIKVYEDKLEDWDFAPQEKRLQSAASVARLALARWEKGQWSEYEDLRPNYMRKAEAERKLEEKAKRK